MQTPERPARPSASYVVSYMSATMADGTGVSMAAEVGVNKIGIEDGGIAVQWGDGHRSVYDARYLRLSCGCAECVEEWSQRKLLDPATVPADLRAEDYLMVGRYAVQILWSDAHFTGIYPFTVLRALCTCRECEAERAADQA